MPRDPRGRVGQARQHEVEDVLGQVVLAGRDEDLGAGDLVRCRRPAARPWCGSGRDRCRIAARSGTSCRTRCRRRASADRAASARREPCIVDARDRRRAERPGYMPKDRLAEQIISSTQKLSAVRQALAAVVGIAGERGPAALAERLVGLLEALRRAHHAVLEACSPPRRRGGSAGSSTSSQSLPASSSTASKISGVASS